MVDDGRRTTDGRTPDHGHPISSPCEPDGSGELKRTTTHCYIQNMKALGHVVSEKKIFLCFAPTRPRGGTCMDPRGTVGRIYKEDHYTLLHTKYERSGTCGFGEEDFFVFPIVSLWELSVAMETRVPIRPGLKPNATFPPPQ